MIIEFTAKDPALANQKYTPGAAASVKTFGGKLIANAQRDRARPGASSVRNARPAARNRAVAGRQGRRWQVRWNRRSEDVGLFGAREPEKPLGYG